LRRRFYHVAVLGAVYVLVFALGVLCNHNITAASFLLAALAFCVFFLQKYNNTISFPPMMMWTCCYLATILPLPILSECLINMSGLIIGYLCAIFTALLIFPKPVEALFYKNDESFLKVANNCIELCNPNSVFRHSKVAFDERFYQYKYRMLALLELSQSMLDASETSDLSEKFSSHLLCQYGLLKSLSMLHEAYISVLMSKNTIPPDSRRALARLLKKYRLILAKNIRGHESRPAVIENALFIFDQHLLSLDITESHLLTSMMNIKVAMGVLCKTLIGLSQRHVSLS